MRLLYKSGPMESLRKWFYKPKRDDRSLLAQFFFADDALNMVAAELDSFDGRKDPERCSTLVNQLRHAQDRVLNITSQIMDQVLGDERVARGFRVKFPEDVLQDNLAGQLWFGAECLAAGSSIMNREEESAAMRPLAKALTRSLETVRALLREQCLRPRGLALSQQDDMLHESLRIFDRLFAEFELCYVSAMVNVKTPHEFEAQQLICVLFSESLRRALKQGLLTQEQVDAYDPALMFAVPRLAIVSGLLIYSSGPLSIDKPPDEMSDMFRPFRALLHKIRALLWTLERRELLALERLLCSSEDIAAHHFLDLNTAVEANDDPSCPYPHITQFVSKFYNDHAHCRDLFTNQSSNEHVITESDYLPDNIEVMTPIIDGLRRLSEDATESYHESHDSHDTLRPQDCQSDSNNGQSDATYCQSDTNHCHSDTTSTDTFQTNDSKDIDRSRKTSKTEGNDLSSLRNLSTNGLMLFDPLVINAVSNDANRQIPDHDLVTSLNEQVTEIADRLSSIVNSDVDLLEHTHSFSANDMPTLITTDCNEAYGFSGPRNEQLSCLPSTSHGYLIPNAISHEPVVLSLSHNNSAVFNQDNDNNELNGVILNNDLSMIIPDDINSEIVNTNISIANANLSSILLHDNVVTDGDDTSFHSAKTTHEEKVKFMLGYDSDHESPVDSGVSTENTSLDRSPDTDQNKEIDVRNRVTDTIQNDTIDTFSETVNINYREEEMHKNQAGSSNVENLNRASSEESLSEAAKELIESKKVLRDWGITPPDEYERQQRNKEKANSEHNNSVRPNTSNSNNSAEITRQKKSKKTASKSKKKKSKTWSHKCVILDNRTMQNQTPLRLNLDHFVDESTSQDVSDCADDEQIALALQAQELAARRQARGKFKSSEDLIHRLFVCIAGVADQLQTNFAADLRNILKAVFLMNQTPDEPDVPDVAPGSGPDKGTIEYEATEAQVIQNGSSFDSVYSAEEVYADNTSDSTASESNTRIVRSNTVNARNSQSDSRRRSETNLQPSASAGDLTCNREESTSSCEGQPGSQSQSQAQCCVAERLPEWVPDIAAPACMRCAAHFTAFRRRHHCRNCGKVFCASCSSNSIPLPRYGQMKPVRVCEECFQNIAQGCRAPRPTTSLHR